MQTIITYPEQGIDGILALLGYTEGDKEDFLNEKISPLVKQAISEVFIGIKQKQLAEATENMPKQVEAMVQGLVSVTTI